MVIYFLLNVLISRTETPAAIVHAVHSSKNIQLNTDFQNLSVPFL